MYRRFITLLAAFAVALVTVLAAPTMAAPTTFVAPLSADQEVADVDSNARGNAIFRLSADGASLEYRLQVANLHNITQAHIHLAPRGENGPIVAWLYPEDAQEQRLIEGRFSGTLATGTITDADLVDPLEGQTVADLVDEIRAGNTYVNVHTQQFPGGELRGQIFN